MSAWNHNNGSDHIVYQHEVYHHGDIDNQDFHHLDADNHHCCCWEWNSQLERKPVLGRSAVGECLLCL